jgi:hypothetical protein
VSERTSNLKQLTERAILELGNLEIVYYPNTFFLKIASGRMFGKQIPFLLVPDEGDA